MHPILIRPSMRRLLLSRRSNPMRLSVLTALLLSICVSVPRALAQSCVPATHVTGMTMEGPCEGGYPWRCNPNEPVTLHVHLASADPFVLPTCPTNITWNLNDGSAPIQTTTAKVEHTFTTIGRFNGARVTVVLPGATRHLDFFYNIANGYIDLAAPPEVMEGSSLTLTATRSGRTDLAATVDYGSRLRGSFAGPSGTLSFAPGEASKTFSVAVPDDTIWNGDTAESGEVYLRNPGNGFLFGNYHTTDGDERVGEHFFIGDNDAATRHKCSQTTLNASEAAGGATFQLERSGNLANATTGTVRIFSSGNWYWDSAFGFVNFAPGEATKSLFVPLPNDNLYIGQQTTTAICAGEGAGVDDGTSTVQLTVREDEPFPTLIAPAAIEIDETDATQRLEIPISVVPQFGRFPEVTISGIGQTAGDDDFEVITQYLNTTLLEADITGDDIPESDERFVIRIAGEISKTITVTIRDDDRPAFPYSFSRTDYEANEDAARIVIERTGDLSAAADLTLFVRPASATQWPVDSLPVHFAAGSPSVEVDIPAADDWFTGERTAILELSLDGFIGATAYLTVHDDETMPALAIGDGSVLEGGLDQTSRLEIPLTLSAPAGYEVKATITLTHGTTSALDFVSTAPVTAFIYPGELTGKVVFTIAGDIDQEDHETFTATITGCCGAVATIARASGTGTIRDDDGAPTATIYRLALTTTEFVEEDRWLTIPLQRLGRISSADLVTLRIAIGDRTFTRQVLFAPNETSKSVRFYVDDDASNDGSGTVELIRDGVLLDRATVELIDNDSDSVFCSMFGVTVWEDDPAGVASFRVSCGASAQPVTLHLRTRSDTAKLAEDYEFLDTTIVIPPGEPRERIINVALRNDAAIEATETFWFDIVEVSGATLIGRYGAGVVLDDDAAHIRVQPATRLNTPFTVRVNFPSPAPTEQSIEVLPGDPTVLEMPRTVTVPAGAASVSFEASARKTADATFVVILPPFLDRVRLQARIVAYEMPPLVLTPEGMQLTPGAEGRIEAVEGVLGGFIASADPSIAAMTRHTGDDGKEFIIVYGVAPGRTEIFVRRSQWEPENLVRVPVFVSEPVTRKRSVR